MPTPPPLPPQPPTCQQGQRHLTVHDMRAVTEGNELTHHLLEAIFTHCCSTKGRPNQVGT